MLSISFNEYCYTGTGISYSSIQKPKVECDSLNVERASIYIWHISICLYTLIYLFVFMSVILLIQTALVSNAENLFISLCQWWHWSEPIICFETTAIYLYLLHTSSPLLQNTTDVRCTLYHFTSLCELDSPGSWCQYLVKVKGDVFAGPDWVITLDTGHSWSL